MFVHSLLFASVLLIGCGAETPPPSLVHYANAQEALADDDFVRAQQALSKMGEVAAAPLNTLATTASRSGDIKAMRTAFKALSTEIIKNDVPEGYVLAFCPMADNDKGAHWIQKDGPSVMNPYFGSSMLHCGVFKD